MKVTPHSIFIYSHGNFLRIVRGEHTTPDTLIKPRCYENLEEALMHERRPRIVSALKLFPPDKVLARRLKKIKEPVKITAHRTLADTIKSSLFLFAQMGYDTKQREVAYIYHRNPSTHRGMTMVHKGDVLTVRKLLKKYKKAPIREHDYQERKPRLAPTAA